MRITKEHLDKFVELVEGGMSQRQAAEEIGGSLKGFQLAFEKAKRVIPTRRGRDWSQLPELVAKGYSQYKIAKILGTKQGYISKLLSELNLQTQPRYTAAHSIALTKELIEYIKENGGTISNAIEKTGLLITPCTFRKHARALGFDWSMYRNAYKMYGKWKLLPCKPKPIYTADFLVQALCTGCNTEYSVSVGNLRAGASLGCINCSAGYEKPLKVVSEDGKSYRSMRAFAKAIDVDYQLIRRVLKHEGCYVHEGTKYFVDD